MFDGTVDPQTGQPNSNEKPVDDLAKLELTVKPGQIFRSTAELGQAYDLALADLTKGFVDRLSDPLRDTPSRKKLDELAWAGRHGVGKRLLAALEATVGYNERSPFAGPTLLDEEIRGEDDTEFVVSVSLDLDALVIFPEEVGEAYEVLEKHTRLDPENEAGLDVFENLDCSGKNPIKCLREKSGIGVRGRWLAGLLPKITFETVDQFDFILAAGQPFPLNEDSLESVTVTWDLGSALDSAKHRRAAIKALGSHRKLAARDDRRNLEPIIKIDRVRVPYGFPVPVQLESVYRGEPEQGGRSPSGVEWHLLGIVADGEMADPVTSGIKVQKTGQLTVRDADPGTYRVRLCLFDDVNNYSRYEQELELTIR